MYDLIIIGAGPAGITAAVYAARKKMSFLVITQDIGGQAAWSGDIENYTGYQFVTGPELVSKFEEHMRKYRIDTKELDAADNHQSRHCTQEKGEECHIELGSLQHFSGLKGNRAIEGCRSP